MNWLDRDESPFESHYLDLETGKLPYIDGGEGQPLVIVQGNPTWSFLYRHLIKDLSPVNRCIAMDHIGFGLSDKPADWTYLPEEHARGVILFAYVTAWIFGCEFSNDTAKKLLALPTPREVIVAAKFVVTALWILGLTVLIFMIGLGIGAVVDLPGWSLGLAWTSFWILMVTALMTFMLMSLVAWFASVGGGYLPPLGWALLTLVLAQVAGVMGWGDWFLWSVPGLFSQMFSVVYGQRVEPIGIHSYILVLFTFIAGMTATFAWWLRADQAQ